MTPTKPTIDECIEFMKHGADPDEINCAISGFLEAHKAIMEAKRPEEPDIVKQDRLDSVPRTYRETRLKYIDALTRYADRMTAESAQWETECHNATMSEKVERQRAETAERQLAELQEKTQHLVEPRNPCNCVPDGDDGTVAHLCKWHKTAFGKAYRMQNMADSLTIENIAKLPQDRLRLWIAHGIQESTARKRAEEQLAELQAKHDALVKAANAVIERWHTPAWKDAPATAVFINNLRAAMSAVALDKGVE